MSDEQQRMAEACPLRRNEFEVRKVLIHSNNNYTDILTINVGNGVSGY